MELSQILLSGTADPATELAPLVVLKPSLVLVFGTLRWLEAVHTACAALCPGVLVAGCTTAGEISAQGVTDDSCVVTAVALQATPVRLAVAAQHTMEDSEQAGAVLGAQLADPALRAVMVLGQGVRINGSALIAGLASQLAPAVSITGGLAGDNGAFQQTHVLTPQGVVADQVVAVGFYGEHVQVSHGSYGGWMPFGPTRKVTRCQSNVLYELDGEPALEVYKRYLGDYARDLPASGLLFPFAMIDKDYRDAGLLRTILGVDEVQGSLTLAGDIDPQGYLKLMHASTDALVEGAETAAQAALAPLAAGTQPVLAVLVSCVGRKLVMGGRVEEEVEAVAGVLSRRATLTGFYSYGEISPLSAELACKLHNQTMTITCLTEQSQ
jgi:hypothetical protein